MVLIFLMVVPNYIFNIFSMSFIQKGPVLCHYYHYFIIVYKLYYFYSPSLLVLTIISDSLLLFSSFLQKWQENDQKEKNPEPDG